MCQKKEGAASVPQIFASFRICMVTAAPSLAILGWALLRESILTDRPKQTSIPLEKATQTVENLPSLNPPIDLDKIKVDYLYRSDIRATTTSEPAPPPPVTTVAHASPIAEVSETQLPEARPATEGAPAPQSRLVLPFYGIQYVPLAELPQVRGLGFDVVLNDFAYDADPATWVTYLDTALALDMRVIPWLWPEGWELNRRTGVWTIDATARRFLETVGRHPATLAVYGLHEPYWNECDTCGYTTAEQQALYRAIKEIEPVSIYSEINGFTFWSEDSREKTIAPEVCDYCQTAFYHFLTDGSYQRYELIAHIEDEIATLRRYAPESHLIWTMSAMSHPGDGLRMPTSDEMRDYASLVYGRPEISGAWWYMWRWDNDLYPTYLAVHPELHATVRKIADEIVAPRRSEPRDAESHKIFMPIIIRRGGPSP